MRIKDRPLLDLSRGGSISADMIIELLNPRGIAGRLRQHFSWPHLRTVIAGSIVSLAVLLTAVSNQAAAQQTMRIAAVVNDRIISIQDLSARLNMVVKSSNLPNTPEVHRRYAPQVLRTLIDEELQLQEAERLNIEITDKDFRRAASILEQRNKIAPGTLRESVTADGIQFETLERQLKAGLAWSKLVRRRFQNVVDVSEEEITEAIEQFKENIGKEQMRVGEILLPVDDPTQEEEVKSLAMRLTQQLRSGANFRAIARQFSKGSNARSGGDIGWVFKGQLNPALEKVLDSMKPGDISEPIRSLFGYHILRLNQRRMNQTTSPLDAQVTLKQVFLPLKAKASEAERSAKLAMAEGISSTLQSCEDVTRVAKEVKSPASPDLGTVVVRELAPALRDPVSKLAKGQASAPIALPSGFMVLMACDRVEPKINIPTRDEVRGRLEGQKFETLAQRYMRDLRRSGFVEPRI